MEFWYTLIGIVALIIVLPYICFLFKQLICMRKLKTVCRKKGYRMHTTRLFWFLGRRQATNCDVFIETANEVLAVKLFGIPRKRSTLILKDNGEYFIRRMIPFFSYASASLYKSNSKSKPMPVYDFRYNYKDEWEIKTPRQILLVTPSTVEIRLQSQRGRELTVGAGDFVGSMELFTLSHLLRILESAL